MVYMAKLKRGARTPSVRYYIYEYPDAKVKTIVSGRHAKGTKVKLSLANGDKYEKRSNGLNGRAPVPHAAARKTTTAAVTIDQLITVKRISDSLGGIGKVREILDLLDGLR